MRERVAGISWQHRYISPPVGGSRDRLSPLHRCAQGLMICVDVRLVRFSIASWHERRQLLLISHAHLGTISPREFIGLSNPNILSHRNEIVTRGSVEWTGFPRVEVDEDNVIFLLSSRKDYVHDLFARRNVRARPGAWGRVTRFVTCVPDLAGS